MYALITTILFIGGLAGMVLGYVDRSAVVLVAGYLVSIAGVLGLSECCCGHSKQRY